MQAKMAEIQLDVTKVILSFLEDWLPRVGGEAWWKECVLYKVSDSQRRHIETLNIDKLSGLDLAALGRILDRNWYDIGFKAGLRQDARHYLKEVLMIRNRWAHAGVEAYPAEDIYRDLDTLVRFLSMFEGDDEVIQKARNSRDAILTKPSTRQPQPEPVDQPIVAPEPEESTAYKVGDLVHLSSDPQRFGPVIGVEPRKEEDRYRVFIDGESKAFYASQLAAHGSDAPGLVPVSFDQFNAQLSARQIQHPSLSTLYSLNAARVDFIPYQFRPVMKFIRSDRPRLLIADGVGVGKTIEAGLILRELQARREIKSVLIICPRPLITEKKWLNEMRRFDERFTQLDGKTLKFCVQECDLEGEWPDQHEKTIIPYSLLDESLIHGDQDSNSRSSKSQKGLLDLDPPPKFDLVIVDEAHHAKNPNTQTHEAVRFFCDNAEAVVFLTATPVQLGSKDLYVLLNMLRPDVVIDEESFNHMSGPNPSINRAVEFARSASEGWEAQAWEAMQEAASTEWGSKILKDNPEFVDLEGLLASGRLSPQQRVAAIQQLEGFHSFSGLINRTRRRDIGEFTVREPRTESVPFTKAQSALHDELLEAQAEILSRLNPGTSINFMMTTIRRQAASCIFGLAPMIGDILSRRDTELFDGFEDQPGEGLPMLEDSDQIVKKITAVKELAGALGDDDPKYDRLKKIIQEKQALPNRRLMVFSTFRHTLSYLSERLTQDGYEIGLVHGGVPDSERVLLRNRFKLDSNDSDSLDVLLFSEVGCEGLDYQFCDAMVNYDLPWNPMKIEQRIGRIDRNGQKSEKVVIYNLITPGTVDAEIYDRCLMRIGIFNRSVGASEEILGNISKEIRSVAEDVTLSKSEQADRLQQLADNEIRDVQEQQALEDRQAELFGIRLPAEQLERDIEGASSYWLSISAIENLITRYLAGLFGEDQEHLLGEKSIKTLRLSQDKRELLLKDFHNLSIKKSPVYKAWADWLKGAEPHLSLTFDSAAASDDPSLMFINPVHPLAKQAASATSKKEEQPFVELSASSSALPPGEYPFAIYEWDYSGVNGDVLLKTVCSDEKVAESFPGILEYARPTRSENLVPLDAEVIDALEGSHHSYWTQAVESHRGKNESVVMFRRESLNKSHNARIAVLDEKLSRVTNSNIQRMRTAQKANAIADYERRLSELDASLIRSDIKAEPMAYGRLTITEEVNNDRVS